MEELLGYALSWLMDAILPDVRKAWGNWGCFTTSILAAALLVWFLPAYVLGWSGGDWKAWLVVGPLATIALVVMVTGTYGLAKGSKPRSDEQKVRAIPQDQEPNDLSTTQASPPQDSMELLQELQDWPGTTSLQAEQHLDHAYAHAERGVFRETVRECNAALRFDPGYAEAHNLRGIALEELGQAERALAAYRQAVRLDPEFSEARENLSEMEAELRGTTS